MKYRLLFLILLFSLTQITAQRFYPSLSNLVEMEEQSSIPKELNYIKKWYDTTIDNVFYQDLQFSGNPRNSAIFKSLGLIFKREKEFEFYNSGLMISLNTEGQKKVNPIRITNNHYWKGLSYGIDIQLDTYDPEGNFYMFLILQRLQSLSNEQTLANFINVFTEPAKNQSSLEKFILDINTKNNINIPYQKGMTLQEVSKEIKNKMPKSNFNWAAYNTYINTKDVQKTRTNIARFFRSLSPKSITSTINETILPEGTIEFSDANAFITLPKRYFNYTGKFSKEAVRFNLYKIAYDLDYNYEQKNYNFIVKLYPRKNNGIKESFKFKYKYKDILKNYKERVKKIEIQKEDLKYMEINFSPNSFSITFETKDEIGYYRFFKDFKKPKVK